MCIATEKGKLEKIKVNLDNKISICVVMSSKGYPEIYKSGFKIKGIQNINKKNCFIYHAGTKVNSGKEFLTSGGRVLNIVVKDKQLQKAKDEAYDIIKKIDCTNLFYRRDIGD